VSAVSCTSNVRVSSLSQFRHDWHGIEQSRNEEGRLSLFLLFYLGLLPIDFQMQE